MRGTPAHVFDVFYHHRFIPAHAGNTPAYIITAFARTGSSPLMRGTRIEKSPGPRQRRFIPAHAGNTYAGLVKHCSWAVHPRSCGEHVNCIHKSVGFCGSSRSCGEHERTCESDRDYRRFIPAHAGNTAAPDDASGSISVHPRSCGEHYKGGGEIWAYHGSSPLMRGTHFGEKGFQEKHRFIPAHAGNTIRSRWMKTLLSVHPRSCGEHIHLERLPILDTGSSPLMRGTRPCPH